MESHVPNDVILLDNQPVDITREELQKLSEPSSLSDFQREKLEKFCKKNWDLFYKRNGDRFFKNRYWTKREFEELFSSEHQFDRDRKYLLEIGCGCGDFALPLIKQCDKQDLEGQDKSCDSEREPNNGLYIYCCDISDRAIDLLKENPVYKKYYKLRIEAFVYDITSIEHDLSSFLNGNMMDFVSLIFVLSAVNPDKTKLVVENIAKVVKPNGLVIFRDYAIYDKAMLRFSKDSKISNQFYVRQDGTRAYFFTMEELLSLFTDRGHFDCQSIDYIRRETVNNATKAKYSRIFLQAKFIKK